MTSAALGHDVLLPRPPGGHGAGAALSLLAHAALLLALTVAVDWRAHTPDVVSAELWASVPQAAAPRAQPVPEPAPAPAPTPAPPAPRVEPPAPAPAEADIAIEQERRREAEAKRAAEAEAKRVAEAEAARRAAEAVRRQAEADKRVAEAEARKKAEEAQRRAEAEKQRLEEQARKAEDARLARQREENLKRIMGQAGGATGSSGSGGTGTAAQSAAPSAAYAGRLVAEIRRHIFFDTATLPDSAVPEVEVRTAPGGTILSRRLVKSSGHKEWDDAVLRAIDRINALPRDVDGRVPPVILVAFRPRDS